MNLLCDAFKKRLSVLSKVAFIGIETISALGTMISITSILPSLKRFLAY